MNACVSHEMRNPINAIHCQNIFMKQLNEQFKQTLNQNLNVHKLNELAC